MVFFLFSTLPRCFYAANQGNDDEFSSIPLVGWVRKKKYTPLPIEELVSKFFFFVYFFFLS